MQEKNQNNFTQNQNHSSVMAAIMGAINEIQMMGANDYEIPTIDKILKDIDEGKISLEDALIKVNEIKRLKMAYH